jgi:hypothetical protein
MNTKLTLTIESTIIKQAKRYANANGRSLSNLVENYLKTITKEDEPADNELTSVVKSLKGSFKPPESFDYKKDLTKILSEKYR